MPVAILSQQEWVFDTKNTLQLKPMPNVWSILTFYRSKTRLQALVSFCSFHFSLWIKRKKEKGSQHREVSLRERWCTLIGRSTNENIVFRHRHTQQIFRNNQGAGYGSRLKIPPKIQCSGERYCDKRRKEPRILMFWTVAWVWVKGGRKVCKRWGACLGTLRTFDIWFSMTDLNFVLCSATAASIHYSLVTEPGTENTVYSKVSRRSKTRLSNRTVFYLKRTAERVYPLASYKNAAPSIKPRNSFLPSSLTVFSPLRKICLSNTFSTQDEAWQEYKLTFKPLLNLCNNITAFYLPVTATWWAQ